MKHRPFFFFYRDQHLVIIMSTIFFKFYLTNFFLNRIKIIIDSLKKYFNNALLKYKKKKTFQFGLGQHEQKMFLRVQPETIQLLRMHKKDESRYINNNSTD